MLIASKQAPFIEAGSQADNDNQLSWRIRGKASIIWAWKQQQHHHHHNPHGNNSSKLSTTSPALAASPSPFSSLSLRSHIAARVDPVRRILRDLGLESVLDLLQDGLILLAADKGDAEPLGTETTGATDTMEVRVRVGGQVVVDGQIDALDVDAPAEDIGGDADALVEFFEFFVAFDAGKSLVEW